MMDRSISALLAISAAMFASEALAEGGQAASEAESETFDYVEPVVKEVQEEPPAATRANILEAAVWRQETIPVCWENPSDADAVARGWVQSKIEGTWQLQSALTLSGWEVCSDDSDGIRILIEDDGPHVEALGRDLDGMENGMVLNFTFENWSTSCSEDKQWCIEVVSVHEFGHALSFAHEQNRPDAPEECQAERQGTDGDWLLTEYDPISVMNYCNPDWNGNGELSALDIAAIRALYGEPRPPVAALERPMDPQPLKEAREAVQQRIDLLSPAGGVLTDEQVRTLALLQEVGPLLDQLVATNPR